MTDSQLLEVRPLSINRRSPSPARPQSSVKQSEPSHPSGLPFLDFTVVDETIGDVYHIAEGGIVNRQMGAQLIGDAPNIGQHADLTVLDNSQNTQYHADGDFRQHYGPIVQYPDSDDYESDRMSSASSSSYVSSDDEEIEHRFVEGRRDSPVMRGLSGRRASERSSAAGSIVESRFSTPPEDIRRPINPVGTTGSADSLAQLVHTVLSQVNGDSPLATPPRGRTPDHVNGNGGNSLPIPNLSPTRPLSTIKRSTSPKPPSLPHDDDPVIPPRLRRDSTGRHTTATMSDSSSLRRVSEAQLNGAPSSDRFSPLPLGDGEEVKGMSSPVQPTRPAQKAGVETSTPNQTDREKKISEKIDKEVEKKAGCLSCCVIC